MKFPSLPPQINRLVVLVFAIVVSYLFARTLLTPDTFREKGFYRGAALQECRDLTPVYAGKVACGVRHPEQLKLIAEGSHKSLSCEACHGPMSPEHLKDPNSKLEKPTTQVCLRCHEANPSRPATFKQITVKDHYEGVCTECHIPHQPNEAPAP